ADHLLKEAADELQGEQQEALVALAFRKLSTAFLAGTRARWLGRLPAPRAREVLRDALRRFNAEERRGAVLRLLHEQSGTLSVAHLLGFLEDLDLGALAPASRAALNALLARELPDEVAHALHARLARSLPREPATLAFAARLQPDAAQRATAARAALVRLAGDRTLDARASTPVEVLLDLLPPDAQRELLAELPESAPWVLR